MAGRVAATAEGELRPGWPAPSLQRGSPETWVLSASPPAALLTAALPTARPGGQGNIKTLGDAYEFAVDVSDFSPEDIIVTTSNNNIEVRAEKVSPLPAPRPWAPRLYPLPRVPTHPGTPHPAQYPSTPRTN